MKNLKKRLKEYWIEICAALAGVIGFLVGLQELLESLGDKQ